MKIVSFKNGEKIKVADVIAEQLNKNILSPDGAKNWQTFTEQSTGECILMINLNEVNYVSTSENIM